VQKKIFLTYKLHLFPNSFPTFTSMIHLSNSWFRVLLIVGLVFSISLPIYKKETSDFSLLEKGIIGITEKISSNAWSFLAESANAIKEKLFEEDKPVPLSKSERFFDNIRTGWQYGLSSIGAADKTLRDAAFHIYHLPSILISLLILFTFVETVLLIFFKRLGSYLGIVSLTSILICLYVFGDLTADKEYSVIFGGIVLFACIQLLLLVSASRSIPQSAVQSA